MRTNLGKLLKLLMNLWAYFWVALPNYG